jgi:hypothetical protein
MELDYRPPYPRTLVQSAVETLRWRFLERMRDVQHSCARQLQEIIKNRGPLNSGNLDCRAAVHEVFWGTFLESLNSAIKEQFQALFEIGSTNPEYAHPDPAHWANDLLWKQINHAFDHTVEFDFDIDDVDSTEPIVGKRVIEGILETTILPAVAQPEDYVEGDVAPKVAIRTDFWVEILNQLGALVSDAEIELARRGWKSPETQSPTITSPLPKAESGPQTDLPSTPQQTPKATSPTVRYAWYRDPAAGVWMISVPPNHKPFPVTDSVGLRYIQVALREHPKELKSSQIQALAQAKVDDTFAFTGLSRLDGSSDGEDWAQEGRPDDGLSDYETEQIPYDRKALYEINQELKRIERELAKATRNNDPGQNIFWRGEKKKLLEQVKKDTGKNHRQRKLSADETRACGTVRRGIVRAIKRISDVDADAGRFLTDNIITGFRVSYRGPEVDWQFDKDACPIAGRDSTAI